MKRVDYPLIGTSEFQQQLQIYLALITLCCMPIMFFCKPFLKWVTYRYKEKKNDYYTLNNCKK